MLRLHEWFPFTAFKWDVSRLSLSRFQGPRGALRLGVVSQKARKDSGCFRLPQILWLKTFYDGWLLRRAF